MPNPLYPKSKAFSKGKIRLDGIHTMHYEEFGNPQGMPVVFLHGGPGAGHSANFHQFFDPKAFRVVVYDQRGCGKSTPGGEIRNNAPDLLVSDIEVLRKHLGIDRWHVWGGSWGTTLALLYAEEHPDRVMSLTLRGVFMMRQKEVDWSYGASPAVGMLRPAGAEAFLAFLPKKERAQPLRAYYNRLMSPDPAVNLPAAAALERQDNFNATLRPPKREEKVKSADGPRIEAHFFLNCTFTPDDRILRNAHRIRRIPTHIVHGLYDIVCPPANAYELHKALPQSSLELTVAGHTSMDPETTKALVRASNRLRDTGSPVAGEKPAIARHAAAPCAGKKRFSR